MNERNPSHRRPVARHLLGGVPATVGTQPGFPPPMRPAQAAPPAGSGGASGAPTPAPATAAGGAFDPPSPAERRYIPNEVLVTTSSTLPPDRLGPVERRLGLTPIAATRIGLIGLVVRRYRLNDGATVRATILALRGNPDVRSAQPNYLFEVQDQSTASTEPPVQYAIDVLKARQAHEISTGASILIGVIDTGIDETNPEIAGRVTDRFDAVGGVFRPHSHGTAMGGVIVAHRNLVGVAPDARLIAIRAFDNLTTGTGQGMTYDIIRGLDFAADHAARIVNMSFAGPRDALMSEALAAARARGMIEVAAAGNAGVGAPPLYPAAEPGVIAITATDDRGRLFAMANRGAYLAAAAPGVDVLAPSVAGTSQLTSGTSVAAAEASGVIALLLQASPKASAEQIRKVLSATGAHLADPDASAPRLIDAAAAVRSLSAPQQVNATPCAATEPRCAH